MSSTLAALAHRDYRLLWYGLIVSNLGTWMQHFALGWVVVEVAGTEGNPNLAPLYLGIVNLSRGAVALVCGLGAGVVADRVDRRALLTWVHVIQIATSAALAAYAIKGDMSLPGLALMSALNAGVQAFDGPTRQAIIPRIVPRQDLMSAIGLLQMAWQGSLILGPLVGGLLIAPVGSAGIFVIKTLSHVPLLVISRALAPLPVVRTGPSASPLADLLEALRYVVRDPIQRWILIISVAGAMLLRSNQGLLPAFTERVLAAGAPELAWLMSGFGLGAFAGAALLAPLGNLPRRGLMLCGSTAAGGVILALFAVQRDVFPAAVLQTVMGATMIVAAGVSLTLAHARTPDALRGRVTSLQSISMNSLNPFGVMAIGTLATFIGLADASIIAAILIVLVCGFAVLSTSTLRSLRTTPEDDR